MHLSLFLALRIVAKKPLNKDLKARRTSVSFPADLYQILEQIAQDKKVSVAWVVRDAVEKYVSNRWPLFPNH